MALRLGRHCGEIRQGYEWCFGILGHTRNNFVHDERRALPHQMIKDAEKLKLEAIENELDEYEHKVWTAFRTISKALKLVEKAVIKKYHSTIHKHLA